MTSTESDIRTLLQERSQSIWDKDLDQLVTFYSHDIVYFDIVPPLNYVGSAALVERFRDWFARYDGPIGQEIGQCDVVVGDDVAVAFMLIRASGTLANGPDVNFWVRATTSFRRAEQTWLITHEHVSVPVDLTTARAVLDLEPPAASPTATSKE
jgi:ketosteroid isomerase-like protein